MNNLKQAGLGAHNYHDANGKFPPAVQVASAPPYGNTNTNGSQSMLSAYVLPSFGPNWAVFILPYIEQDALYRSVNVGAYLATKGADQTWRQLKATKIPTYLCPSDPNTDVPCGLSGGPWARGNIAANGGPGWMNQTCSGLCGTGGSTGTPSLTASINPNINAGGVFGVNWGSNLPEVTAKDGTSNTIMFNEIRAGINQDDRRGCWAMGPGGSITCGNAIGDATGPNDSNEYSDDIEDCSLARTTAGLPQTTGMGPLKIGCSNDNRPRNWPNWQVQARSTHPGGVNACFSDGSVKFIADSVSQLTWWQINARDDGQVPASAY